MSLWSKGIQRSESDEQRKENNLLPLIDDFFNNRKEPVSYEIVDDKNWIVDINGNLHLYQSDIDAGQPTFRIGKLAGNLYFHGKHLPHSVIPADMDGDIVFVPDEEESAKTKGQKGNTEEEENAGMELLRTAPSSEQVYRQLEEVMSDLVYYGYDFDFEALKKKLNDEFAKRDTYRLKIEFDKKNPSSKQFRCRIYVDDSGEPLDLTSIETAVYLTFMLFEDGIRPDYLTPKFYQSIRKIYMHLSGTVQDWSDNSGSVMVKEFDLTTLNGHRSMIRKAIKARISNKRVVDDFAIEGYKEKPFKVSKATVAIRNQIKTTFGIE